MIYLAIWLISFNLGYALFIRHTSANDNISSVFLSSLLVLLLPIFLAVLCSLELYDGCQARRIIDKGHIE